MKDWKCASVRGCPDRMMAARSHSMSSILELDLNHRHPLLGSHTLIQISFVKVVRSWNIHIIETRNLFQSAQAHLQLQAMAYVTMPSEML
jgi:hypothetical protein